ncbi:penicillin-binding transpeptidase domain-containing protein [Actinotalea solisilvae]|uniref:penicillin-binding transpeptidase domain-containing protein n=1 Tax=Actinotalea solisilvae TaxID=2072922 RepID=UPI0027DB21A4|nr:penicillin-binding transpeptidase domain-containing protein [Actinotalea solisilvae]
MGRVGAPRARGGWRGRVARAVAAGTAAGVVAAALTACTPADPEPDAALAALAEGLASGDLSDVPLHGTSAEDATAQLAAAVAGLAPRVPTIEVGAITVDDEAGTATAQLAHTWPLEPASAGTEGSEGAEGSAEDPAEDEDGTATAGPSDTESDTESDTDPADPADPAGGSPAPGVAGEAWTYSTTARLTLVEREWLVDWSTFVIAPDLRETETLSVRRDAPAERATVLGSAGAEVLVEAREVVRLGFDKTRVDPAAQPAAAQAMAELLGLDPAEFAARVAAAGEKAFVEGLVVRTAAPAVSLEDFGQLDGANAVPDVLPLGPSRRFAREVLGTAGPATAEVIEASAGAVVAGDVVGLSGLQRQYDAQLRGLPGLSVLATASDTQQERVLFSRPPVAGEPLVTTIATPFQEAADSVLADVPVAASIVAVRPSTGAVVAVANGPGSGGWSGATLGTYAPGSVFKVVSALALLRAGLTPDSPVECSDGITVEGRRFDNVPGYPAEALGSVPLRTAFAHSCNAAFIALRDQAPPEALAQAAASLGLGVEQDLGFARFAGAVPLDSTGTDHAAAMIGQGRVQASPLAMATVAASVAAGRTVTPWLVGAQAPPATSDAPPLTADEAAALRDLMRAVVTDGGGSALADVPGGDVLAKTGTAQFQADDGLRNHAWMIGVQGDLAVAVFVEDGESGAATAGPLLADFLALAPE